MKFRITHKGEAKIAHGRRGFFVYRDFGIEEASNGYMRVTSYSAKKAMSMETGWHCHTCGAQLLYIIRGWAEVRFEDGNIRHMPAGTVVFIPGGSVHNEIRMSDDWEALEVVVPGEMGTVPCDPPQV
jgi:quercetin dioxygenase-like cupin family protein